MKGENYDVWLEGVDRPTYLPTILPQETEYVIVGGGITGVTTAYLLSKEGKKVILVEKIRLGEWVTDCTTAFLTAEIDTPPEKLIKNFGLEKTQLILASHREAINDIEKIIRTENIECEFTRCSDYIYANNKQEEKNLQKTLTALKKIGIQAELKKDGALKFSKFAYIDMPNQAKFHVMKYLTALAKIASRNGVMISEGTEVTSLENTSSGVNVTLKDGAIIKAKKAISATYGPFGKIPYLTQKASMYRSYVIEYKLPPSDMIEATYSDELDPYHYFRIDRKNGFSNLIIGGEDNLEITKPDRELSYTALRNYVNKLFVGYKLTEVRYWSGLILNSTDGIAHIGTSKRGNIFYAFGFGGNGMTYSYIAGKIIVDTIMNRENIYKEIYQVDRKISWWKKLFL